MLNSYRTPLFIAIVLHALIIGLVLLGFKHSSNSVGSNLQPHKKVKIVKAVTVDQTKVDREIHQLKREKERKLREELARTNRLKEAARKARSQRIREQKRLSVLHRKQLMKAQAEKMRLAKLKKQQNQALKRLQMIKQEQLSAQKKRLAVAKKIAALKKQQRLLAFKKKAKKNQQALKLAREHELMQQLEAEQKQLNAQRQQRIQSMISRYTDLIKNSIYQHWIVPFHVKQNLYTVLYIKLAPGGTVLSVDVVKSSGDIALDQSARAAVFKSSPLPVPKNQDVFKELKEIRLTVRPEKLLS